ncbi:hypothetical protein [Nocardioides aequoreus]|uniref:hypothetical protein n=1 Tax=Nocardioides aequoreus TaxID=397278 RepID=UPI0012F6DD5B|nr:hypothetical protein [Nocardioides aequoreus]
MTDAKSAGGVDNLIADIEGNAVADAAPRLLAIGAGVGALVVLAARWSAHRYGDWKAGREARAETAKAELRAVVDTDADQAATSNDEAGREGEIQ